MCGMAVKTWQFLLPESGNHTVRVHKIGTREQDIEVDGQILPANAQRTSSGGGSASCVFTGLGDAVCELRAHGKAWHLYVNGLLVEDYSADRRETKDETLRNLKGRPEGSYLIQTEIPAENFNLHVIRKFRFVLQGVLREVQVAHWDWIWQIMLDGKIVDRVAHEKSIEVGESNFDVRAEDGTRLPAAIHMAWQPKINIWRYRLYVAGAEVPVCWTKATGDVQPPSEPPVIGEDIPLCPNACQAAAEAEARNVVQESLPQGVSYDAASGMYQANIRSAAGRFVFLGDFSTPEEAHQRYLEAIPSHNPGRPVLP